MTSEFKHPLARRAKVWAAKSREGADQPLLVVVTTLELDPKKNGYSKKLVDRLTKAAEVHVAEAAELGGFLLVNRPRDWRS